MGSLVHNRHPAAIAEYEFVCRNSDVDLSPYVNEIREEIHNFISLKLLPEEIEYLKNNLPFLSDDYIRFFSGTNMHDAGIEVSAKNGNKLNIKIFGWWCDYIYGEVPILAIVNEVYFRNNKNISYKDGVNLLIDDINKIRLASSSDKRIPFKLMEFGTRRRFSAAWQEVVLNTLMDNIPDNVIGTSNVYLAMKKGIKPLGTMAHEYLCAYQAISHNLRNSQKDALGDWLLEYRGNLAVALTDTLGSDAFIADMDQFFLKNYTGFRHDSGDAYLWTEKMLKMFNDNGINPLDKTLVYSNGLSVDEAIKIYLKYQEKVNVSFGIGTHLTNRFPGVKPLNIVMKLVALNGHPVAKLSDEPGKAICRSDKFLEFIKETFNYKDVA